MLQWYGISYLDTEDWDFNLVNAPVAKSYSETG